MAFPAFGGNSRLVTKTPEAINLTPPAADSAQHRLIVVAMLLIIAVAGRAQTFGNPVLGYDEQFYLLVGDRMLHGAIPFVDIFDRKPIGLFLIYAFIRLLGGEGTLQYQLVAGLFAWVTAITIWRFGRRVANEPGAIAAAAAYLIWLDFMEGEGGQTPVFFNLPVLIAAAIVEQLIRRKAVTARSGALPMLVIGVAMQIKYTVLFEGIFFGSALILAAWRARPDAPRLLVVGACWIVAALAPTLAAFLTYALSGNANAFLFANFFSMWGKLPDPMATSIVGLLTIVVILLPLFGCAAFPPSTSDMSQALARRFVWHWVFASILGMLIMRSFSTPQYGIPVLVPALIAAAPRLAQAGRGRQWFWGGLVAAFIISQIVLTSLQSLKGRDREAAKIALAAKPKSGCLFVYDGYPALYRLTNSCLLSHYVFPGHLNMANEASVRALGVDPSREVRRIMAMRPETVTMDYPPFERVNQQTYNIMEHELMSHYALVFSMRTGDRQRLVYRRREKMRVLANI